MKKYETLIFDLDDTLIDNVSSIKYAFKLVLEELDLEYNDDLFDKWVLFDKYYWHQWEIGNITIPSKIKTTEDKVIYLRVNRFLEFFKDMDFEQAYELNNLYIDNLGENILEINGASETIRELSDDYDILIATNGAKSAALKKVEKIGIVPYISEVISSEEVGFSKPHNRFFNHLFAKTKTKEKSQMIIIGDSLTTDVLGGMNNGIDTCWFNPTNEDLPVEYNPTITINKLLQLKKKL